MAHVYFEGALQQNMGEKANQGLTEREGSARERDN
jgi:hypothetical protein